MRNSVKFVIIIMSFVLFGSFFLFLSNQISEKHINEINRVISQRNGKTQNIIKTTQRGPFKEVGKANTIYKIEYEINQKKYIAWYRAINSTNIHKTTSSSYDEKWIFLE